MDKAILDDSLIFIGIKDFWLNKGLIKRHYQTIDYKQTMIFKWYIYQQPFLYEKEKDILWEFLNDDIDETIVLEKLKRHLN